MNKIWSLYILRCKDNTLYTGITTNVERRFNEHNSQGKLSAKYVRGRAPLKLIYNREIGNQSNALIIENKFKRLSKLEKANWITSRSMLHSAATKLNEELFMPVKKKVVKKRIVILRCFYFCVHMFHVELMDLKRHLFAANVPCGTLIRCEYID